MTELLGVAQYLKFTLNLALLMGQRNIFLAVEWRYGKCYASPYSHAPKMVYLALEASMFSLMD